MFSTCCTPDGCKVGVRQRLRAGKPLAWVVSQQLLHEIHRLCAGMRYEAADAAALARRKTEACRIAALLCKGLQDLGWRLPQHALYPVNLVHLAGACACGASTDPAAAQRRRGCCTVLRSSGKALSRGEGNIRKHGGVRVPGKTGNRLTTSKNTQPTPQVSIFCV